MIKEYARYEAAVIDMEFDIVRRSLMLKPDSEVDYIDEWIIGVKSISGVSFKYALTNGSEMFYTTNRSMFVVALQYWLQ